MLNLSNSPSFNDTTIFLIESDKTNAKLLPKFFTTPISMYFRIGRTFYVREKKHYRSSIIVYS